ncbi:ABC transporter substrate-binding protein [Cupriavidus oxalaticus]|uniref:ABC transporter substrate-binding protein n=1 Tax=Cupriavidus oxalaticus TaxID=96344 RepID=UPI0031708662
MRPDPDLIAAFAPTGVLRASINLGNPILANRGEDGQPFGVSVDLANALAQRLGLPLQLVVVDAAGKSVEVVSSEEADVGFFAIDPKRAATIRFTAPYVLIEGWYLVRDASPVRSNAEVDAAGNRVAVGKGSAYDLFLTRALKAAQIVRALTSPNVVQTFLEQGLDVAAGVRQQLEADAAKHPGLRLLDERFMVIRQAMGLPQSRGSAAAAYLHAFVEEMKASGFVAQALARHQIAGASVAPAEAAG